MRKYNQQERDFMKSYVPGHSHKEICEAFNKRFSPPISVAQVKVYITNNKLNTGRTGRFEKGHIPANKGKKLSKEMYDKAAPTMFKSGHKPANTLPVGTEKMLADGYIWVKIDDQVGVRKQVNWKQKHKLIWEAANGPVPEGCIITFLDGNHSNCSLENLQLITKEQNARLNRHGLRGDSAEITQLGIAVADLISATAAAEKRIKQETT